MTPGPRGRLIGSAINLVRERGVDGTGLADLLEHSGAARRSIYQHFPGGKAELIATSTRGAGAWIQRALHDLGSGGNPVLVITTIVEQTAKNLVENDYRLGCPIAAAAAANPDVPQIRDAAAEVFESWTEEITGALEKSGTSPSEARSLAGFAVSAIEGALLRSRCARSPEPLEQAAQHLVALLAIPG